MVLASRRAPLAEFVQRAARQAGTRAPQSPADAGLAEAGVAPIGCVDEGFAVDADLVVGDDVRDVAPGL